MASDDRVVLLASDAEAGTIASDLQTEKRYVSRKAIGSLVLSAVTFTAVWRSFAAPSPVEITVENVMSAAFWDFPLNPWTTVDCPAIWLTTAWPHLWVDVNWEGECSRNEVSSCQDRIVEKFVGDYFDAFIQLADNDANEQRYLPGLAERVKWKDRVIKRIQALDKCEFQVVFSRHKPAPWAPLAWNAHDPLVAGYGAVCEAIFEERVIVPTAVATPCPPDHRTWRSVARHFGTVLPTNWDHLCDTVGVPCQSSAPVEGLHYPSEYGWDSNPNLEKCRHLLTHKGEGQDWINAALSVLDVRMCLSMGEEFSNSPLSRSWVSACIPSVPGGDARTTGWPGWVFDFIREYGAVEQSCIPDSESLDAERVMGWAQCPSLCENGDSLSGRVRWFSGDYAVIFNPHVGVAGNDQYDDLRTNQMEAAKAHIYKDGPIMGLISKTLVLAACANDDQILYGLSGGDNGEVWGKAGVPNNNGRPGFECGDRWDGKNNLHAVVVHGFGAENRGGRWWRITGSAFQTEDHDIRIAECAVKMFIIPPPLTEKSKSVQDLSRSFWDPSFNAYKAEAACQRPSDFCVDAGYTESEDCDGDGVLDHWCYRVADGFESFISSRDECKASFENCRRSVLPGRKFGCQRPNGWCMGGETYRRDIDCDGDDLFDHVCESAGHNGFISSTNDCIDTWGEGTTGRKCEPKTLETAVTKPYRLVHDSGTCVEHTTPQCFQSAGWPDVKYQDNEKCSLHVEWDKPAEAAADGCDKPVPTSALYLEVIAWDVEDPIYTPAGGFMCGDRMTLGSAPVKTAFRQAVQPEAQIQWLADLSVNKGGWLVCLRERRKNDGVYHAACNELGDDLWARLDIYAGDSVAVECDDCITHEDVAPYGAYLDTFVRTKSICRAGMHVTKKNTFTVTFSDHNGAEEGRFQISP